MLYQSTYGGDYEDGGEGGAVQCEDCCGMYVTGLCSSRPDFDSGKSHNHCTRCPDFGQCIGDYREAHCGRCGEHYFAGLQGFKCPCRGGNPERNAWNDDDSSSQSSYGSEPAPPATVVDPTAAPPPGAFDAVLPGVEASELYSLRATCKALVGPSSYLGRLREAVEAGGEGLVNVGAAEHVLQMVPTAEQIDQLGDLHELRETVVTLMAFSPDSGDDEDSGDDSESLAEEPN